MPECPNCNNNYIYGNTICPHCNHLLYDAQETLSPGTLLQDRYEVYELFYVGSRYYIYTAKDKKLYDRPCIVKQLKKRISSDSEKAQIEQAILQIAQVNFPNVAMLLDHFIIEDFYYLIVEYIDGKTLTQVQKDPDITITEEEVIHWAIAICDIVNPIHKQNIIHGDINTSSIMLTSEGFIKFVDFDTSHQLNHISLQSYVDSGKYIFIPPEQWREKGDIRSDIYSIGAVVFFMLTGYIPAVPEQLISGKDMASGKNPVFPQIRSINADISSELDAVLQKTLEPVVGNRYPSLTGLTHDLKNIIRKEPILSVDCDAIDFSNIIPGKKYTKKIIVSNEGSSKLVGKLQIDRPWIEYSPGSIELETGTQEVQVTVDALNLAPGFTDTADLSIVTNGGKKSLSVNVSVSAGIFSYVTGWTSRHKPLTIGIGIVAVLVIASLVLVNTVLKDTSTVSTESVLLFQDDFQSTSSGWYVGSDEWGSSEYKKGQYQLNVVENNYNILGRSNDVIGPLGDFALEVDASLISGPENVWYGVGFRQVDKENSYDFLINSGEPGGKASFAILKQVNGEWIALKDWTESGHINEGNSTNHIKLICKGNTIEAYVNDQKLSKVTDDAYGKGVITFEAAKESGGEALIAYDNLIIYVPR
jgi:serine/threonine protein kinase